MNNETDNSNDAGASDPADGALDDLLRAAEWPDDASDPLNRLLVTALWPDLVAIPIRGKRQLVGTRKRKWILAAVGAAAAVIVGAAVWAMRGSGNYDSRGDGTIVDANGADLEADKSRVAAQSLPSRDERLRACLAEIREKDASDDRMVVRIVTRRTAEPNGNLEDLAQPLLGRRSDFEQCLLRRYYAFASEQEASAIELLGVVGSEASVPLLLYERLKPSTHAAAVRALLRIADSATLAQLQRLERDAGLRQEITDALEPRDDEQTTDSTFIFTKGDQSCLEFQPETSSRSELF
jgi:hypothetical protein